MGPQFFTAMRIVGFLFNPQGGTHMKVYFDEQHYLREAPLEKKHLQQKIAEYEQHFPFTEALEKYRLASILGYYYRLYSIYSPTDIVVAENYFHICLEYARQINDSKKELVTLVRLGETYKYSDLHALALNSFKKAMHICNKHHIESHRDFILQHMGKCYMEVGFYQKAKNCFLQALSLRKQKKNVELIESTKQAILLNHKLEIGKKFPS